MEFSDLFIQGARNVLPRVQAKGIVAYFDYYGDDIELDGEQVGVRSAIHRLFLGIADLQQGGYLICDASAARLADGHAVVTVTANGIGARESATETRQVLDRLDLHHHPRDAAATGTGVVSRSHGICPATGGDVVFVDRGQQGASMSLRTRLRCRAGRTIEGEPNAGGAAAWLVSSVPGALHAVERKLSHLGWQVATFAGVESLMAAMDAALIDPRTEPKLLVAAEGSGLELPLLEEISERAPSIWTVMAVLAGSVGLISRDASPVDIRLMPFSSREYARFTAHVDPSTTTAASRQSAPAPRYELAVRRILVVDDNILNQLVAEAILEGLGCEVSVASDGVDAVAACQAHPPAMVLMDVEMPRMGGLAATRSIRTLQTRGLAAPFPIVAATSDGDQLRRNACRAAGMDGFLTKPLQVRSVADELLRLLPRPVATS